MSSCQKYCGVHDNMELAFYCSYHDITCCRACISKTHQSCENVVSIDVASKDVRKSSLLTETLDGLINIAHTLQTALKSNETNLERLDNSATSIKREIAAYKRQLTKQLDDIERHLLRQLRTTHKNLKVKMEKAKNYAAEKMTETEKIQHDLAFFKEHGTNNQLFMALHAYDREIKETGRKISDLTSTCNDIDIRYDKTAIDFESMGNISQTSRSCDERSDITIRSLTKFKRDSEVALKKEIHNSISDIAVTFDDKLLICIFSQDNPSVYIYTDCKDFEGEFTFPSPSGPPYRIAVIPGTSKAVVTLWKDPSIQFVNTETLQKEDKVKLRFQPLSVTASSKRIFMGGVNEIFITDIKGVIQETISVPGISYINFIRLNKNNTELFCRGSTKLFCVDLDGNILYKNKEPGLAGIAVDRYNSVYVGENETNKIHRLSPEGKFGDIMLTEDDGINCPHSMTFNNDCNRLFIVNSYGSTITCFACS